MSTQEPDRPPHHTRHLGRRPRWQTLLLVVLCLGLGFAGGSVLRSGAHAKEGSGGADVYARLDTFAQVISQIERSYVEDVAPETLIYGAVKGMVRSLDPHSTFLTPDELERLRSRSEGNFVGIGVEVGVRNGELTVIAPLPGGPAEAAGVQSGDVVIAIDGESTRDWSLNDAVERMRGAEGTKVRLTIERKDVPEAIDVELMRAVVKLISVEHELLETGYGLIRVQSFVRNVGHDVRKSYDALVAESGGGELKGLVLDLRNNPGGLLAEAVDLANVFMENGLIVSTEGRDGFELARHDADPRRAYIDVPLVVLVNGGSASASEIVAGALQDHRRAVIVGTQTFGKGSVQNIYDLEDGSGLKLTIARYFTPAHRSIQGLGIAPDIIAEDVELPEAPVAQRVREADLSGALEGSAGAALAPDGARQPQRIADLPVHTALDQLKAYRILSGKE